MPMKITQSWLLTGFEPVLSSIPDTFGATNICFQFVLCFLEIEATLHL